MRMESHQERGARADTFPMRSTPDRAAAVAVLMLQPECNMTCTFCVTEDGFDVMRFEDAVEILDRLVERGVSSVVLGGGEPFLWPGDVVRLAREARARGLTVQVGSNGVDLPPGFADLDCIDRWVLPLESARPGPHDELRRFERRHHALILQRLGELQSAGRAVTVSTVLTAVNTGGLRELALFLRGYHAAGRNVHAWHLYRFLPLGRGGSRHREALDIPAEQYLAACREVQGLGLPFRVFVRSDMYRSRTVRFFWSAQGRLLEDGRALGGEPAPERAGPG